MSRDMTKPTKWQCAQRRPRSALASAKSDQSLRCALNGYIKTQVFFKRTAKTLIRLGGCLGWSESWLGARSFCWFCHVAAHIYKGSIKRFQQKSHSLLFNPYLIRLIHLSKLFISSNWHLQRTERARLKKCLYFSFYNMFIWSLNTKLNQIKKKKKKKKDFIKNHQKFIKCGYMYNV